jgi:hypothetical protein
MALNILAPEWPFAQAVCGFTSECQLGKDFKTFSKLDNVPWSRSHTQLANMGGFVIRFSPELRESVPAEQVVRQSEDTPCVVDEYCHTRRWKLDSGGMLYTADWRCRSWNGQHAKSLDVNEGYHGTDSDVAYESHHEALPLR